MVVSMLLFLRLASVMLVLSFLPLQSAQAQTNLTAAQVVVFLADNNAFIKDWHDLPAGAAPHIKTFRQVQTGKTYTLGLAAKIPEGISGNRKYVFEIKLLAPDGSVAMHEMQYSTASGIVPKQGGFMLADPALTLDFLPKDSKGEYHVYIQMTDVETGTPSYGEYQFTLQ